MRGDGDALCILGDGIGNLIEQTALAQAAAAFYDAVDVWTPRTSPEAAAVILGTPGVRDVYRDRNKPPTRHYAVAFATFLTTRGLRFVDADVKHKGALPQQYQAGEGAVVLRALRSAGYRGEQPAPYCGWDEWQGERFGSPLLAVSAGGNASPVWRHKRYERYAEIIDHVLHARPDVAIVQLGGETDDEIPHAAVRDLRGVAEIRRVCGLLRTCDVFLGNDCGLGHAAAALGVPSVLLFGPTVIWKNLPPGDAVAVHTDIACRPCQYTSRKIGRKRGAVRCDRECMRLLDPKRAAKEVLRRLPHA